MAEESARWAAISPRPTHGTATPVAVPSVLPEGKRDREVFWVGALVSRLPELQGLHPTVASCEDDSHGKHDVIVTLDTGVTIGVQVTELTSELERKWQDQRQRFLASVERCFRGRGLSSHRQLLVKCFAPYVGSSQYRVPNPQALANATAAFIQEAREDKTVEVDSVLVLFQWVGESTFYVPSLNGIGVDCDVDVVPRSLDLYCDAIAALREKKASSRSPWLLIWSLEFWRDKHWLGEDTVSYMQESFAAATFDRVYFLQSMDGAGWFEANLTVHLIKG